MTIDKIDTQYKTKQGQLIKAKGVKEKNENNLNNRCIHQVLAKCHGINWQVAKDLLASLFNLLWTPILYHIPVKRLEY